MTNPVTHDARTMYATLVDELFAKAKQERPDVDPMFVASVAIKGLGDIGFGPVRQHASGLLVLLVIGKGEGGKATKMERHFAVGDIAMLGVVQNLTLEPPSRIHTS